jgi:hypothetical protein
MTTHAFKLLFLIMLLSAPACAQVQGDQVYIFPRLLVKVDTQHWNANTYGTFLNSLKGFAELKSKRDPEILLSIRPLTSVTDTTVYSQCKCYPQHHKTYPNYQKVLQSRSLVIERDTFYLSVHQSYNKTVSFHIATCKTDPDDCQLRISAIGPVKDSTFIKESLIQVGRHIQHTTPARMDSLFRLPQEQADRVKAEPRQLAYYDAAWQKQYVGNLAMASNDSRAYYIKSIRELHRNNYEPVGWTSLPALEKLPLESLVRIKARYYHLGYIKGPESIRLVPHFFPPAFTYVQYEQSMMKLIRGKFTMDDVARFFRREAYRPGQPFYYSRLTSSDDNYPLFYFRNMVKPLFPGYNIVDVNPPSAPDDNKHVFAVFHQVSEKRRAEGYVIYKHEGDRYEREIIPPLWTDDKNISLESLQAPDPYRLRQLKDWRNNYTYQVRQIYLLDHKKDSSFWVSYPLPVLNDSSYTITFQFSGPFEDFPVMNKSKWVKLHPGEHPDNYYKVRSVKDGEDISKELEIDKASRDKLLRSATPADRLYTYTYLVEDINKDGKKELVSFSVSNGKLVFYKCYSYNAAGLVSLTGKKTEASIMTTEAYKKLYRRSLLPMDMAEK